MNDRGADRATLIFSRAWISPESELSFVTRSVAGAASRTSHVVVAVPSPVGPPRPDGAFDLFGTGVGSNGSWPSPSEASWPAPIPADATIIVDEPDSASLALLGHFTSDRALHTIAPMDSADGRTSVSPLDFTGSSDNSGDGFIGLHVPINPVAATHRHNGLGFTGYLLVLSDRNCAPDVAPPTALVAWLTARFPTSYVVVVEDAAAAVWRGRALRGIVSVYTRTDLWRLMAHARVTIDIAPGRIVARECIESLRYGTPIIVPAQSVARPHADSGGGMTYTGFADLLDCVAELSDETVRDTMSARGRRYADAQYGDEKAFVSRVSRALGATVPSRT